MSHDKPKNNITDNLNSWICEQNCYTVLHFSKVCVRCNRIRRCLGLNLSGGDFANASLTAESRAVSALCKSTTHKCCRVSVAKWWDLGWGSVPLCCRVCVAKWLDVEERQWVYEVSTKWLPLPTGLPLPALAKSPLSLWSKLFTADCHRFCPNII